MYQRDILPAEQLDQQGPLGLSPDIPHTQSVAHTWQLTHVVTHTHTHTHPVANVATGH